LETKEGLVKGKETEAEKTEKPGRRKGDISL